MVVSNIKINVIFQRYSQNRTLANHHNISMYLKEFNITIDN